MSFRRPLMDAEAFYYQFRYTHTWPGVSRAEKGETLSLGLVGGPVGAVIRESHRFASLKFVHFIADTEGYKVDCIFRDLRNARSIFSDDGWPALVCRRSQTLGDGTVAAFDPLQNKLVIPHAYQVVRRDGSVVKTASTSCRGRIFDGVIRREPVDQKHGLFREPPATATGRLIFPAGTMSFVTG